MGLGLVFYVALSVPSSFTVISLGKREVTVALYLCHVAVIVHLIFFSTNQYFMRLSSVKLRVRCINM